MEHVRSTLELAHYHSKFSSKASIGQFFEIMQLSMYNVMIDANAMPESKGSPQSN